MRACAPPISYQLYMLLCLLFPPSGCTGPEIGSIQPGCSTKLCYPGLAVSVRWLCALVHRCWPPFPPPPLPLVALLVCARTVFLLSCYRLLAFVEHLRLCACVCVYVRGGFFSGRLLAEPFVKFQIPIKDLNIVLV